MLNTGAYRTQTIRVFRHPSKYVFKSWLEPVKIDSPGCICTTKRNHSGGYKRKLAIMVFTFVIRIVFSGE